MSEPSELAGAAGAGAAAGASIVGALLTYLGVRRKVEASTEVARVEQQTERVRIETEGELTLTEQLLSRIATLEARLDEERERTRCHARALDEVAYRLQRELDAEDTGQHRLAEVRRTLSEAPPPPARRALPRAAGFRPPSRGHEES